MLYIAGMHTLFQLLGSRVSRGEGREGKKVKLPKAGGKGRRKKEIERDSIRYKVSDQEWPLSLFFLS